MIKACRGMLFYKATWFMINRSLLIALAVVLLAGSVSAQGAKLVIVFSDSLKSTQRTIRGITSTIEQGCQNCEFHEFLLERDTDLISGQISRIKALNPALIVTVGSMATQIMSDKITDRPIIFSAVLNPETSGFVKSLARPGKNITGASLDIPFDIQFTYFKQVIGGLKKIGVLYTTETANLIPPAKALAHTEGLELEAIEVNSEKDIPSALEKLIGDVDGIWSVADAHIFTQRSTKFILLNTLRNGVPFMGFSRNLVESGALFALDFDYKDIGRQSGEIALRVLGGQPASNIPVAVPRIRWFHYNEKTAKHINVKIPDELVAVAKEVYR